MSITTAASAKHYRLSPDRGEQLLMADLTAAEWRIWCYLALLDPFGDGYQQLPDMLTVMQKCRVSKATFYRAIAKFQELELFDFQASILFRNLSGAKSQTRSELRITSQDCDGSLKSETDFAELKLDSQDCDSAYIDRARIQTIHNYSNYSHSSERAGAGEASETDSEPEQTNLPVNSEKPETAEDPQTPSSAAPPSPVVAFDSRMRGGNLQPWERSPKRFDYDPGFIQFLMASYLPTLFCYKTQAPTIDKAQQWLNSARYNEERKDVAHLQWERYQKSLEAQAQGQDQDQPCHPFREFRPAELTETVSLAAAAAKFRQRLLGGAV